jgi:hypothetical protein
VYRAAIAITVIIGPIAVVIVIHNHSPMPSNSAFQRTAIAPAEFGC